MAAATLLAVSVPAAERNGFTLEPSLIDPRQIHAGGPPRDGIPAIYTPRFVRPAEVKRLADDDRVLGTFIDGVAKARPASSH